MKLTTTENFGSQKYEIIGLVQGSMVQSKNIAQDIVSGFRNIIGGEINDYTQMLEEAREVATQRLIQHAHALGADAVVSFRYSTSSIMQGAAEILAYGTAVRFV